MRRRKLTKPKKRRGKFRSISYYDWDKIYPLQHFQIDLKVIRDHKSLPWATYQHIQKYKLPPYQWTAIDPYTKTKFLAYSYEKSFSNGLTFMLLIHLWLRSFGITHQLFFQTDWGEEFGGKSLAKLAGLQEGTFDLSKSSSCASARGSGKITPTWSAPIVPMMRSSMFPLSNLSLDLRSTSPKPLNTYTLLIASDLISGSLCLGRRPIKGSKSSTPN